ncbi:hypothetical protein GCM10022268_08220 [Sphingomonas cynarae]|uniref:DUF2934 domain-containing protein n=1 Tax=Sphingomonas cynarae TaxID=930197 RepID=A0ABP7D7P4_9SPHN
MSEEREQSIRRRAYELWEQGGGDHGRDQDHWHQASGEIDGAGDAPAPNAVAPDGTTFGDATGATDTAEGDGGNGASIVEAETAAPPTPVAPVKPAGKAAASASNRPRKTKTTK